MLLLLAGLASAACDPAAAVAALPVTAAREDYACAYGAEEGKDLLLAAIAADTTGKTERLTRALALWLLARTDRAMDPAVVAALAPADRRLLADGIRARRGRASPAPDHVRVFEQFAWYTPVPTYTDARLRPIDRENLLVVDPPVRPEPAPQEPPPAEAPAAGAPAAGAPAAPDAGARSNLCGCSQTSTPPVGAALALLAAIGLRRRR